jgi:hypothetical protein
MGLVDVQALKHAYDEKKEHQNGHLEHRNPNLEHPSSPQGASMEHGSSVPEIAPNPLNKATSIEMPKKNGKLTSWDERGSMPSNPTPMVAAGAR